jgi:hypothetical protein
VECYFRRTFGYSLNSEEDLDNVRKVPTGNQTNEQSKKPPLDENMSAEAARLQEGRTGKNPWRTWGPYLSDRQWGTVREDYSQDGNAWDYFTHDQARSRAYHWGEDGLAGITTTSSCFVSAWLCGTARIPSSKNACSG